LAEVVSPARIPDDFTHVTRAPHEAWFDEYRRLTPVSGLLYDAARRRIPGGVSSSVRFFPPYPVFMSGASGARVTDADGREYVDYCLAFGPLVTGHGHPAVLEAIRSTLDRLGTVIFGAPIELELAYADRLARLVPSAEMVRFTGSGTEATMHALRIARGATGRPRIVKFEGHYHGVHDAVLWNVDRPLPPAAATDGIPAAEAGSTLVLPFNDIEALRAALDESDDIAAVIVEPVARGAVEAEPAFLRALREMTRRRGIVLVFDEVVSWPRVSLGGAQALYGVTPDLTALGKAIGGGLPLAAVVGRRDLMSLVTPPAARARDDRAPHVFHGGTCNATPIALAAGLAVLDELEAPGAFERWSGTGRRMREALAELFARRGRAAQVIGTGSTFDFYFTDRPIRSARDVWASDLDERRRIDYGLLARGVYNSPVHRFHLSTVHADADLDFTLSAIDDALAR
jgi:glutamate-1-semialdehyde 2,1-aminomutase